MKYFLQVFDISFNERGERQTKMISKTEYSTKTKVERASKNKTITTEQLKQIHVCYHDEDKIKKCEIL